MLSREGHCTARRSWVTHLCIYLGLHVPSSLDTSFTIFGRCRRQEYSDTSDPTWVIGSVIPLPTNSWSDGYSAGLDIVRVVCVSNSTFWQATGPDPTDVEIWKCEHNHWSYLVLRSRFCSDLMLAARLGIVVTCVRQSIFKKRSRTFSSISCRLFQLFGAYIAWRKHSDSLFYRSKRLSSYPYTRCTPVELRRCRPSPHFSIRIVSS